MRKKDYVVIFNDEEIICTTLKEARKIAKNESKGSNTAIINKWVYDNVLGDLIIDEQFEIEYQNGKEQKVWQHLFYYELTFNIYKIILQVK